MTHNTNIVEKATVHDFLIVLEDHRLQCEKGGKYIEAEIAKNRVLELKAHERKRRVETLKCKHISEKLGLEEANLLEYENFKSHWAKKETSVVSKGREQIKYLEQQQEIARIEFFKEFTSKINKLNKNNIFPRSKQLINTRFIEKCLVKKKDYQQAARYHARGNMLEKHEKSKYLEILQSSFNKKKNMHQKKQQREFQSLEKRVNVASEELKKRKAESLERMVKRYDNLKVDLGRAHNMERLAMEKLNFKV